MSVCRKYHKNIIGREGATINQIRKDTNTKIEMPPPQDSTSDGIKIIGRRENVEKAKKKILEIESQQVKGFDFVDQMSNWSLLSVPSSFRKISKIFVLECSLNFIIHLFVPFHGMLKK